MRVNGWSSSEKAGTLIEAALMEFSGMESLPRQQSAKCLCYTLFAAHQVLALGGVPHSVTSSSESDGYCVGPSGADSGYSSPLLTANQNPPSQQLVSST